MPHGRAPNFQHRFFKQPKTFILLGSKIALSTTLFVLVTAAPLQAQEDADNLDKIEAELQRSQRRPLPESRSRRDHRAGEAISSQAAKVESLSDLALLSPFEEVSVIEKRFMPKTHRFQFFGGLSTIANDPWFLGVGLNGRLGFGFSESLGIELNFLSLSSSTKDITNDLATNNRVDASTLVTVKSYLGADIVFTPFYGKIALFNERIIPYDMYFALGAGNSSLGNSVVNSATTYHLGTGQIFAITKGIGFRWDLSLNHFNIPAGTLSNVGGLGNDRTEVTTSANSLTNILLSFGVSFYFPEAKYR